MAPKLYMIPASPPVRAVLLTAKALDVNLELIPVNLLEKEHLKPEFLKINPQHTVPTLDDDGFIVWDSHAINGYLVNKYGKDDSLYPKDAKKRAIIDQRLHFDTGVLFATLRATVIPILLHGAKEIQLEKIDEIRQAYSFLEAFLEGNKWIAGDSVTIADLCIISTVTSLDTLVPFKREKHPNLTAWIRRCETLPYFGVNKEGLQMFRNLLESKLKF